MNLDPLVCRDIQVPIELTSWWRFRFLLPTMDSWFFFSFRSLPVFKWLYGCICWPEICCKVPSNFCRRSTAYRNQLYSGKFICLSYRKYVMTSCSSSKQGAWSNKNLGGHEFDPWWFLGFNILWVFLSKCCRGRPVISWD